ncbi:MAG TPA: hypothetical protein VLG09_04635 [Candidatus Saccharimonadales bacterium]|nr:hypothetical protein [Candidatus Saccharimonadales bacterium]
MNIKQKITTLFLGLILFVGVITYMAPTAMAADCGAKKGEICCGDTKTSIIGGTICKDVSGGGSAQNSGIWAILLLVLNIMTAGVGVLAVGGIVYGSIMYASAADKAEQTKKAMSIITNVVVGLIAYALMYLGLNFLIPGGIFS